MNVREQVLITPAELARLAESGDPLRILDVRWRLDAPDGRPAYLDGHIPGAVYVSLEDELTDHTVPGRGRHPLPSGQSLQEALRRWGVRENELIVVYDDWNRVGSARAWWLCTAAGLDKVRILDGGLRAWLASGGGLDRGAVEPPPGNVTVAHQDLYAGAQPTLTAEQTAQVALFDARAPERYRGEVEPLDPVAGHIPGAKNLPFGTLLTADGTFVANSHPLPDGAVGTYCGSGVTAAVVVAAFAAAGRQAALYPGSWSEWCSDSARPVARGDE
ncbi:sulfurtransferase [Mycobacterium gordonae]|uniref:sulfurtransferase n=1 Tax=Mycobacterium gordonae TaxID=1778 RepID=UPI000B100F74|nr:sulfurtransferase [Mycobacterium gordonae]MBX9979160.1 sulfurtransferase [Mycobacterium gordonae]MCQ4362208.1 sulfurtransferase [Mycobacterium gordonae]MCV7004725.1 sulfurtransferase [Mycobacterium gordonae]